MSLVRYNAIVQTLQRRDWEVYCWPVDGSGSTRTWMATAQHLDAPACVSAGEKLGEALTDLFRQCCKEEARFDWFLPTPPALTNRFPAAPLQLDKPWQNPRCSLKPPVDVSHMRSAARVKRRRVWRLSAKAAVAAILALIAA